MTADWAIANLPLTSDGLVVLVRNEDGSVQQGIDPAVLETITAPVADPPTHAGLSALPISAGGYQSVWDGWKAAGLIS